MVCVSVGHPFAVCALKVEDQMLGGLGGGVHCGTGVSHDERFA